MAQEINLEELVTELYILLGHQIERVVERGGRTFDLIIKANNGERWIVRCEQSREVNDSIVREFLQVLQVEKARQAAIITRGVVTPQARQLAKGNPVHLVDGNQFHNYLREARALAQTDRRTPAQGSPQTKVKSDETLHNASSGNSFTQRKISRAPNIATPNQNAQKRTLWPIIAILAGALFVLCLLSTLVVPLSGTSNSPAMTATRTPIPTTGVREFGFDETILLCGDYRVEKGERWDTVITVCDTSGWEQVSVKPDLVYPGKALITWRVDNKELLFAWSGDALILFEAWEHP